MKVPRLLFTSKIHKGIDMSTDYIPVDSISYKEVKKLCPEIKFVKTKHAENKWGEVMQLEEDCMHFTDYKNKITAFTRYGANQVTDMIDLIQFRLATPIYDEYSKEYEEMTQDLFQEGMEVSDD